MLGPEHAALAKAARPKAVALEPGADSLDDATLAAKVAALGWYPYLVPAAHGGALPRVDVRSVCVLREELAARNAAADSLFAVQGLGSHPLVLMGSDAQRQELLPKVAAGAVLFAFALTEPEAGSDVAALSTTARRDGDTYVLDGQKKFISNAGVATHYTVFARTAEGTRGLSAFIVPAETAGLHVTPMKMMGEHPIGALELAGCRVPASARVGDEGAGMKLALGTLDVFRSTVGAAAVGMARRALDEAIPYAKARKQFGKPLAELQAVQALLADSAVELEASRLLVHKAAAAKDAGAERITYEAAVAKLFATEAAQRIIDRAVQIHGGNGVVHGAVVERLYRDVRALRIYEGASEVQRLVIARHLLGRVTSVESWEPYLSYAMALFSGLLIGLEREHSRSEQQPEAGQFVAGVRTTPLFSLCACIAATLSTGFGVWPFVIVLVGALALSLVNFARNPTGLTSIGAFLVAVMLGGLSGTTRVFPSDKTKVIAVAALSVVATLLLSVKPLLHNFSSKISRDDVIATLKFLMVAVVVLPLLPDAPHGPWGVLNPFKIGMMVSLLAGVSFVGYAASRILGRGRGLLWAGAIGGLVSSTAVTLSASRQTKAAPELADFSAISVIIASTVMAVRVLIVASATNPAMAGTLLWPMSFVALTGVGYAGLLYWRSRHQKRGEEAALTNPFELSSALQMTALLVGVILFSKWTTEQFGQGAAYVTAFFAGFADVDAVTLSMARLSQTDAIALTTATAAIFCAVVSNTIVKGSMTAVLGNKALAGRVAVGFGSMMVMGGAGVWLSTLVR